MGNGLANLKYVDPKRGVWRSLILSVFHGVVAPRLQKSRTRRPERKPELEFRQGALFAFARAHIEHDATLKFAMVPEESNSADAILRTGSTPDAYKYERVQLKEIVPNTVDERQTLKGLVEAVRLRYCTGEVLTVAIHLNRDIVTSFGGLAPPPLPGVTFWIFGLCDANRGFIVKDPFDRFEVREFDIPRAPSSLTQW